MAYKALVLAAAAVGITVAACGGARSNGSGDGCQLGVAEQYPYCFFSRREYVAPFRERVTGPCPHGYDGARIEVATGTVCLSQAAATVPPEVCATLPDGCASATDRTQVTPTDARRDALTREHDMRFGRCGDRAFRPEPLADRLADADVQAHESELRAAYASHRSVWMNAVRPCCAAGGLTGGVCVWLRLGVSTPDTLDAALVELASIASPTSGRPGLMLDTTPPEP